MGQVDALRSPHHWTRVRRQAAGHAVEPGAGGVDHHARAHVRFIACEQILHAHAAGYCGHHLRMIQGDRAVRARIHDILHRQALGRIHLRVVIREGALQSGLRAGPGSSLRASVIERWRWLGRLLSKLRAS